MMAEAAIARLHDVREGFDVVDFAHVGLPIFRLTVEAVTLSRQELPTTQEFVLRAIKIGEDQADGIAALLGLSVRDVADALHTLRYDRAVEIVLAASTMEEAGSYRLTELGRETLENGTQTPRDEIIVADYDGIRRRVIKLSTENLLRPKELSEKGAIQIRPYPLEPPEARELQATEVGKAARRKSGKDLTRGVLAIRKIVRRENLFRPALALLFQGRGTGEMRIGFVIGDQNAEDYEIEFARHGGTKRPGVIRAREGENTLAALRNFLGPDLVKHVAELSRASALRLRETEARRERVQIVARLERKRRKPKLEVDDESLPTVEERVQRASAELRSLRLRPLAPYEQWELFDEAIESAKRRLVITSADVDGDVFHSRLLRKLDALLDDGVEVRIETSRALTTDPRGAVGSFEPAIELFLRNQTKKGLTVKDRPTPDDSLFFLIKDDDLAVISSRPFLCGRGRKPSLMPVVGVVATDKEFVGEIARLSGLEATTTKPRRR